jgi:hypothetical protein
MKPIEKPSHWASLKLNEKLLYYKDHLTEEVVPFIDKLQVKPYITEVTQGKCKVAKVVRVLDGPEDITQDDLIPGRIIKTTHASGWNIFVVEKTKLDLVKERLKSYNKPYVGNDEQHYSFLTPGFFIEERVPDFFYGTKEKKCITFSFRCVHGEPLSINVRDFLYKEQNNYLLNGTPIGSLAFPFTMPPEINTMLDLARLLSKPFEFVRVDFYLSADREIYFSEFTFTPMGGRPFYPDEYEIEFGKLWV